MSGKNFLFLRSIPRSVALTLAIGVLPLLLSGCRMNEAVYNRDGSRIIYMRPPLLKVVDELDERHKAVQSVFARLNVILRDNVTHKETVGTGIYMGDKDGNMRLQITHSSNHRILDMGFHGDQVDIHLPLKKRFYQGKRADLLSSASCELSLLAHAGKAADLFFPRAWTDEAINRNIVVRNGREIISVVEKHSRFKKRSRRLTLAPESASVEWLEVYDKRGNEIGNIEYSDYIFPDADNPDSCPLLRPGKIVLNSSDRLHSLELEIEELTLNLEIDADKFTVPLPEECKPLDLGAKLKSGKTLWE